MARLGTITRRTLLVGSAAVAGGVVFGFWKYKQPYHNPLLNTDDAGTAALTPYVRIDADGVTLIAPRAEMGQGVHTTLAALVAEELDVALADVQVEHGPASKAYFNAAMFEEGVPFAATDDGFVAETVRSLMHVPAKFLGLQVTGGSSSIPDGFVKMRKAGAAARLTLLEAAARELGVPVSTLRTEDGHVIAEDGTRVAYTALAGAAAALEVPDDPPLKPSTQWRILGRSQPRVDMLGKCTGEALYSIDVRLPGMLHATVKMNPRLGGGLKSFDASKAQTMPGVKRIIELDGGVAVVATHTWYAFKAADAIDFEWGEAPYPSTTDAHFDAVRQAFDSEPDSMLRDDGDVEAETPDAELIEGEYEVPYLAHASMEPLNALALFDNGRLDVWAGSQAPTQVLADGARICDLDEQDVHVHTTLMGGAFGRRADVDYIRGAIEIAKAMPGTPVKTTWSREEDMCHDSYRPLALARFKAAFTERGPVSLDLHLAAPSVSASQMGKNGYPAPGQDKTIVQAAWDQPYAIDSYRVTGYRATPLMPVGYWRSVGASQNGFFVESIIDEIAHASGNDPLQMRLSLIDHEPSRKALEAVAEMSEWGSPLPAGRARGVAHVLAFGVPCAEVVEVEQTAGGLRIVKVYAAVDVGIALDPDNIEAQIQSGIIYGLAAAVMGEVTVSDGVVQQTNFHDYDAIRMYQAPRIEVRVLEHGDKIRGVGEPGTPPAAPALANAIFAATGVRMRAMPFQRFVRFA